MTMLAPGDTFRIAEPYQDIDVHLWIVVSDPTVDRSKVLIANLTSWRPDKDQRCVLNPADHPFINHKSCVNYAESRIASAAWIEEALDRKALLRHERVDPEILERIREGARVSRDIPLGNRELLKKQGLID